MLLTITLLTPSSRTADIFSTAREPPARMSPTGTLFMTDTSATNAPRSATAGRFLHSLTPMRSRDPHEEHRVATTLDEASLARARSLVGLKGYATFRSVPPDGRR